MTDLPSQPPCLVDFQHVNRYWDRIHKTWVAKILPGEFYVTIEENEAISTTLGSCVSACMRDKVLGIGGMNHFMLPQQGKYGTNTWTDFATRYGSYAMEHLINNILKNGGTRSNLEIKLTGGGKIIAKMTDVGAKNIAFALDYLQTENLALTTQDVGDIYPRKIIYFPASGRLRVKKLRTLQNNTVIQREQVYLDELSAQSGSGEVELF